MKRVSMVLASAAMLFAVSPAVAGEGVESDLAEMRELMKGLQQKVDAQEEQLESQSKLLEQAQKANRDQVEESRSGLSPFLDSISVGGHISGSYGYNFNTLQGNDSRTDANSGESGFFYPFHRDSDTFNIDQIWFSLGKEPTEESRAGFQFDILLGQNANFLGQGVPDDASRRYNTFDGTSDYYVAAANIQYMCDCFGPEINWTFGKFQTIVGAEVVQDTGNFNITRGIVYGYQPVDHMGLTATTDITDMVQFTAGLVSSEFSSASAPDDNNEMSYLASLLFGDERMNIRTSLLYGAEPVGNTNNGQRIGILDVTAWFNPSDNLSLWANYDYIWAEGSAAQVNALALAGRLQVTEKVGAAARFEYSHEDSGSGGGNFPVGEFASGITVNRPNAGNLEMYSLTGTLDYALTDHLTGRAEIRYDDILTNHVEEFFKNNNGLDDQQTVGMLQVIYAF